MIIPVILSGGSGTRLWPLSRKLHPKQFLSLINETTLLQDTILRLPKTTEPPLIICNEEHRFLAAEQLRQINITPNGIILEPIGKNTAPAIALAALKLINENTDPILLVLSADHLIQNNNAFHEAIAFAEILANKDKLVTFGIVPDKAETGYGYIETGESLNNNCYDIKSFKEKPHKKDAQLYLESNKYLWNSGMFMFKASNYLYELEKFEPEIFNLCKKSLDTTKKKDFDFIRLNNKDFFQCPNKSIDYAIMEKTENAVVVSLDARWSDIGSWTSLFSASNKDKDGNVTSGDVILDNVSNTFTLSSNRLVSVSAVSNLIIVDSQDALLITDNNGNNISNIISKLKNNNRPELENHRKVFRPWGYYDSIDSGIGFQVKRIFVNPGAKLSLQKHKKRAEHWVIVKGIASITCGDKVFQLEENQSTFIPKGEIHRLENAGKIPLEIIEIQTGSYLGEDDIIRLEDDYQRN